ncbi:hypothetical protein A2U01_0062438, partial [Trifolium medium]|nr:hypothetical protein [Trifolium medium]
HYPARSAGTRSQNALNRAALCAAQVTPARCATNRRKTGQQPHCCASRQLPSRAAQLPEEKPER